MNASKIFIFLFLLSAIVIAFLVSRSGTPNETNSQNPSKEVQEQTLAPVKLHKITNFELTNQEGETFSSQSLLGKIWIVDFVFTRCQGPCPLITQKMQTLQNEFKREDKIRFVSITMDPSYDKPELLKSFGQKFEADFSRWSFLTGDHDKILDIARNIFKVPADKNPEMHTTRFVLIDSNSYMRGYYNSLEPESFNKLVSDIHKIK